MIVIGYQGIGKTTLASKSLKYIDLESSNFWVDGKRDENWYKVYCKIAVSLSRNGYVVFTSSHQVVRDYLLELQTTQDIGDVVIICPTIELKDLWVKRLEDRYKGTGLEKDYKAWKNAEDRYEDNIKELEADGEHFEIMQIRGMNYKLLDMLNILEEHFTKVRNWLLFVGEYW